MLTLSIAGWVVVMAFLCVLAWASWERCGEFQRQLETLTAAVRKLEQGAPDRARAADTSAPAEVPKIGIVAGKAARRVVVPSLGVQESPGVPPETQAVIKATLSALLGREVRIRSVKLMEKPDAATTWVTQGRIAIQSSHNQLAIRG